MIEWTYGSCSTFRAVVKALWCSVKSRWHEPEGRRGKEEERWPAHGRAEWLFVFLRAKKWPHVIDMTEQWLDNISTSVSFQATWRRDLALWSRLNARNRGVGVSFRFLSLFISPSAEILWPSLITGFHAFVFEYMCLRFTVIYEKSWCEKHPF